MIRVEQVRDADRASQLAADDIVNSLTTHASGKSLFLVSGGSSAKVAYWASSRMDINVTNSTTLAQVDERYGPVGHKDSNWQLLIDQDIDPGLFENSLEILKLGSSPEDVADSYSMRLQQTIDESDYSIALLGMGGDAHIAGMLPMEDSKFSELFLGPNLATSFKGEDFERITITARTLMQLDRVVVFAAGHSKAEAVSKLNMPQVVHQYPAEILKQCKDVVVYYGKED